MGRPRKQPAVESPPTSVSETPSPVATLPEPPPSRKPASSSPSERMAQKTPLKAKGMLSCLRAAANFIQSSPQLNLLRGATTTLRTVLAVHTVDAELIDTRELFHQRLLDELLEDGALKEEYRVLGIVLMRKTAFLYDPEGLAGCLLQFAALRVIKDFVVAENE